MENKSFERFDKVVRPLFTIVMVIIVVVMAALIAILISQLNDDLYEDRTEHMEELVEKSSDIVSEIVTTSFAYADNLAHLLDTDLAPTDDINDFLSQTATIINAKHSTFIAIDVNGTYYTQDGIVGKIIDSEHYKSTSPKKEIYISSLKDQINGMEDMFFRIKLDTPNPAKHGDQSINIAYCAVVRTMDYIFVKMNKNINTSTNSFIFDINDGTMLYRHLGYGLLLDGWNFYNKLYNDKLKYLGKEDPTVLEQMIKDKESTTAEFEINGVGYFMGAKNIADTDLVYALIVSTNDFSSSLEEYKLNLLWYLIGIILLLTLAVIITTIFFIKLASHKKLLIKEQAANVFLTKAASSAEEAAEAAKKASTAKSDFLSHMSHDIRTPINGIMGMTSIALKEENPEKTVECLNKINGASEHLLSLINDVLDMSRIEAGRITITNKPIELKSVMDNCISIIRGQVGVRDLKINLNYNNVEFPHLLGDELHLRQVFINVLGNAVKFTPDGGSITFSVKELEQTEKTKTYKFRIEDTGIGMSKEFLAHIWDAFSQEDDGARTQFKGTGLGMAITKQFVEMMGGDITVESKKDKGSAFNIIVTFDINEEYEDVKSINVETLNVKGIKVLLVEDNELNMEIAKTLLEDNGIIVDTAENGKIAFDKFLDAPDDAYDAILMDVMMPEMNGLETTRAIRGCYKDNAKTIPIIAMTANAYDEDIKKTMDAGMNEHISKPIEINVVLKALSKYVRGEN